MTSCKTLAVLAILSLTAASAFCADATPSPDKLIALTFDDGPRPYVLFGSKEVPSRLPLINALDGNGVKATFFADLLCRRGVVWCSLAGLLALALRCARASP